MTLERSQSTPPHDVFLSYARADAEQVRPLVEALEAEGWSVWWDPAIVPGLEFHDEIEAALDAARCIVVVWSSRSVSSHWVRNEAEEGRARGILVPVRIDGSRPPLNFRGLQTADLGGSRRSGQLEEVLLGVRRVLDAGGADSSESIPGRGDERAQGRAGPARHRARLLLVGACSVLLLSLFAYFDDTLDRLDGEDPFVDAAAPSVPEGAGVDEAGAAYATCRLTTDVSALTEAETRMIPLLIEAAREMDAIFWRQSFGEPDALLASIDDPGLRRLAEINYGPWDRLKGNAPFVEGYGPKPPGARFYPADVTREELEAHLASHPEDREGFESPYTVIRRDVARRLHAVLYSRAFAVETERAAALLDRAAALAEDPGLENYLRLRAEALRTDDYRESDRAWMDMEDNGIDVVIGPIETYEDQLLGLKAAHEGYVLVKDRAWSSRLARYAELLPTLQRELPVPDAYKSVLPTGRSDHGAYDVVFYAGECNAGAKTIAVNLPNDVRVQLEKGSRRLHLKNAMRAKFETILDPIADALISEDQRELVTFDAFFANTMFHEVSHGLGIEDTVTGRGRVRDALAEHASVLEEAKAHVLGLGIFEWLYEHREAPEASRSETYVTFLAGAFRSVRHGAQSASGSGIMICFNSLEHMGAFRRDADGRYAVVFDRMEAAVEVLSREILTIQGDGDYEVAARMVEELGGIGPELQADLDRLTGDIHIAFEQGEEVLGLEAAPR